MPWLPLGAEEGEKDKGEEGKSEQDSAEGIPSEQLTVVSTSMALFFVSEDADESRAKMLNCVASLCFWFFMSGWIRTNYL